MFVIILTGCNRPLPTTNTTIAAKNTAVDEKATAEYVKLFVDASSTEIGEGMENLNFQELILGKNFFKAKNVLYGITQQKIDSCQRLRTGFTELAQKIAAKSTKGIAPELIEFSGHLQQELLETTKILAQLETQLTKSKRWHDANSLTPLLEGFIAPFTGDASGIQRVLREEKEHIKELSEITAQLDQKQMDFGRLKIEASTLQRKLNDRFGDRWLKTIF